MNYTPEIRTCLLQLKQTESFERETNMASPSQIAANRQNAALSSGPISVEGKGVSSRNATRHGLTGSQIVMPGEDAAAYEEARKGLWQAYEPATEAERLLTDQIAANAWRLMRAQRVETAFLSKLTEGSEDPDAAIALAFLERSKDLARIHRYVAAAQNAYYKAMRELSKLQKERSGSEQEVPESAASAEEHSAEIGFVSYPAETPCTAQPNQRSNATSGHGHDGQNYM
jgi:hypothetical protein